jgi:hypothetical protein
VENFYGYFTLAGVVRLALTQDCETGRHPESCARSEGFIK